MKYITIKNELLKKSRVVRIFIGLDENNVHQLKKYEGILKPKLFSEMCMPDGKLSFPKYDCLAPIDKYLNNSQALIGGVDGHYDKLRRALDTLHCNYDHLCKSLLDVSAIFDSLETLLHKFNCENTHK
jgi:hypothetical protein